MNPKDEMEYWAASLIDPNKTYYIEESNETYHSADAFALLFGWGDHQWIRDALNLDEDKK